MPQRPERDTENDAKCASARAEANVKISDLRSMALEPKVLVSAGGVGERRGASRLLLRPVRVEKIKDAANYPIT